MRTGLAVIAILMMWALPGCREVRHADSASMGRPPTAMPSPSPPPVAASVQLPSDFPSFPLPAPRPSARVDLPFTLLGPGMATIGAVEQALRRSLAAKGYDDRSYYAVPGGFALATRAERFLPDGRSAASPRRWAMAPSALIDWAQLRDPRQWIDAFRNADPGHYRVLLFLVTTRDRTSGGARVDIETAQAWTQGGADRLPRVIAALPLSPDHHLQVLVYEFARVAVDANPAFVPNSAIGARAHLRGAGLIGG